jgi:hypothetical protein
VLGRCQWEVHLAFLREVEANAFSSRPVPEAQVGVADMVTADDNVGNGVFATRFHLALQLNGYR